uniref:Locomotion-related protein Hikaru genki n=1 Tax=Cacopsylla melanoneura TaxID=428564 RepID=A0A8D9AKK9_9HEMI
MRSGWGRCVLRINETIPHNGEIKLRCQEPLGLYKLLGESSTRCNNGKWAAELPLCIPTTSITNFTVESPPTILVRIPSGTAAVDEDTLIVFPGSILHLECLYLRKAGNPQWTWTSSFRQYLTGWAIAAEEREWKYRLSIYYVKLLDSGVFTCTTPRGLSNSVQVTVKGVHCERLTLRTHELLKTKIDGHRLGQMAHFHCPPGTIREGPANITCMANGQWSGEVPTCQQIICPKIVVENPYLTLVEQNNTYGGHALFQCSWGYQLKGPPDIVCQKNGSWSGATPDCLAVHCPPPILPLNGHLIEDPTGGPYRVGAILQFACNDRHHLIGEETIVCTETGQWSRAPPRCKARCEYPGEPPNGKIIPLKFFYDPGDHIQVTCNDGYVKPLDISPPGSGPYCQSDGTWSVVIPHCTNYTDV